MLQKINIMITRNYFIGLLIIFTLSACVTGNDDNAVLNELEEQFAKTPRVENLAIDDVAPSRDQQSHWVDFEVMPGQVIRIIGKYHPGVGANSAEFDFSRSYHHTSYDEDDARPVEPNNERIILLDKKTIKENCLP